MAVPAHDSRDYAFAKHFNLEIRPLIEGCDVSEESFDAKEGIMSQDKTLNSINIVGDYAYFSTNFGILILNLKKKEITNTYVLNKKIYSSVVKDNVIYAATADGLYSGKLTDNLLDANNWVLSNAIAFNQLVIFENKIIGNQPNYGIYSFDNNSLELTSIIGGNFSYMEVFDNKLIAGSGNSIAIFDHFNSVKYMQ